MKIINKAIATALIILISACTSNKGVTELTQLQTPVKKVTIVRDADTRASVLPVLEQWFYDNSIKYDVVNSHQETEKNSNILTYKAWWSWDIATYMRKADLQLSNEGIPLSIVKFDALQYGGFGKFGNAEERLKILMDVMFAKISEEEANKKLGQQ